jgi:tetratricopeptide (TPR) repeat protein
VFYLSERGAAHAGLGHWKEAAQDMLQAVDSGSEDLVVWNGAAILCLWTGDSPRYRRLCDELLRHFGDIKDVVRSSGLAYLCSLGPEPSHDLHLAIAMARRLVEGRPSDSEQRTIYGAVLYRAGEHADAIRQLEESIRLNGNGGTLADWLFLSLASQRLGRDEEGRRWLAKAEERIDADHQPVPGKPAPQWTLPLHNEILRAEARSLLSGKAKTP